LHETEDTFDSLDLLSAILGRVEDETFSASLLRDIAERLTSHQVRGSVAIARLRKIVDLSMSRDNLFVRLLNVPLMYSLQVAISAENWRRVHGHAVSGWLSAVGSIEALLSLATYRYEHPADPFPELLSGEAYFDAEGLGHPLIPTAKCVTNNVHLGNGTRTLLVSGSNMSGKSTLLRAVGTNTVLAMAGAPVRAQRLRLTVLQIGASIRVNDSLQEGSSRFYAEIKRLRQIWDLASRSPHLLFLMDELLQGTNSKDRQIGAEGIVRALIDRGAIGLVTTHDLALAAVDASLAGQVQNVHFQDELEAGRIHFDYLLREGVVTKSNGLALMRSIGLEV
jgi:DNA mismatch repair ATPase MutS